MPNACQTLCYLSFLLCFIISSKLTAQINVVDSASHVDAQTKQLDLSDVFNQNKKNHLRQPTDSGKKSLGPYYTAIPYPGYALVTGYLIGLINTVSFYTHHGQGAKISTIVIDDIYTQYHQYINIVRSNIWLKHEKFNLLGDWRYYQFPTNTFGLGSSTSLLDKDSVNYSHIRINEILMLKIANNFSGGLGLNIDYHWHISEINHSKIITDMAKYGYGNKSMSSGLSLNFQYDNRLNSNNPDKGSYVNLQIRNNLKSLGSNSNWQSLTLDMRHYFKLSKRSRHILALWSYNALTLSGMPPYFDLPSTGWDTYNNTARDYVEGRFRGLNLIYAEAEYRFQLSKNQLFGGVVFTNMSALTNWPNNAFEKINPGAGLGLRIKMNKSSNTNLCIDYGFGAMGSKGFAFNLNEVF